MHFFVNFAKFLETTVAQNTSGQFILIEVLLKGIFKKSFLKIMKVFLKMAFLRKFFFCGNSEMSITLF